MKTSPHAIDQSHTRRLIYAAISSIYPVLPPFNVYRYAIDCASRVLQLYVSRPVIYSANESLKAISSGRVTVIVYIFCFGLEILY